MFCLPIAGYTLNDINVGECWLIASKLHVSWLIASKLHVSWQVTPVYPQQMYNRIDCKKKTKSWKQKIFML